MTIEMAIPIKNKKNSYLEIYQDNCKLNKNQKRWGER